MADSFYLPLGDDRWQATIHTTGPWDEQSQHGGPPSALLARAIQRHSPRPEMMVTRFTCEILSPVPVGEIEVRARVARPGRRVELLEAEISAGGRQVASARAWRVQRTGSLSAGPRPPSPPPLPAQPAPRVPGGWVDGYLSAVEWRPVRGGFGQPGSAVVWARLRYPLVPGEDMSPLERVLAVADSGSGVGGELDFLQWYCINPELTVHLHREAEGEWICLEAATAISAGGAGLATTMLSDQAGPVGVAAQSLLVARR